MLSGVFQNIEDREFIEDLSKVLTRTVFDAIQIPYDMEIPKDSLKNEVYKENDAVKLLLMLCYVNVDYDDQ